MALDWQMEVSKRLRGRGPTPKCDKLVSQRRDSLLAFYGQTAVTGNEISILYGGKYDPSIDREVFNTVASKVGDEESVETAATASELVAFYSRDKATSTLAVHTHPGVVPAPSETDIATLIQQFQAKLTGAMIIGVVPRDIPPDLGKTSFEPLPKNVVLYGIERQNPTTFNDATLKAYTKILQEEAEQAVEQTDPIRSLTYVKLQDKMTQLPGIEANLCYHNLGTVEEAKQAYQDKRDMLG